MRLPFADLALAVSATTTVLLVVRVESAKPDEVTCPCADFAPNTICTGTGVDYGCPGLPRMKVSSMTNIFNDFATEQNNLFGEVRFPVTCPNQKDSIYVGTTINRDQQICTDCGTGTVTAANQCGCDDSPNIGCLKSLSSGSSVCVGGNNEGASCTSDEECTPNNGANAGYCDPEDICDCQPGPYGYLRLYVQDDKCGATHDYWDGDIGIGTSYGDSYQLSGLSPQEVNVCKDAIRTVCLDLA